MSVYVDALAQTKARNTQAFRVGQKNGHLWCHLIADTDAELRGFALLLGLRPSWLQNAGTPTAHYDLTPGRRRAAVAAGAIEVDRRGLVAVIRRRREIRP